MKYSCQNCNTCCISTSPLVSYCGILSECNPSHVPYTQAVGLTVLTVFLLAAVLFILYFAFKDRKLGQPQQKEQEAMRDEIKIKSKAIVSQKVEDKKQNIKSNKVSGQLNINSKISKKPKTKPRSSRSLKKAENPTETERGLR